MQEALTKLELRDLINRYRSERNKLIFQLRILDDTLQGLSTRLSNTSEDLSYNLNDTSETVSQKSAPKSKTSEKRVETFKSTPAKSDKPSTSANKRKGKKNERRKTRKPGKLNEWDKVIVNALESENKVMLSGELKEHIAKFAGEKYPTMDEDEVTSRLARTLQKLANRNGTLKKVKHTGRGYGYAMPDWVSNNGSVKKPFRR